MEKPEALRLADAIDPFVRPYAPDHLTSKVAAAELRRLHDENKILHQWHHDANLEYTRVLVQRDALLEALKTYGWHTEDCPQYPTHARPKNWPACTCGFDAAIKAVKENT